jgi:cell division septation protein DedD
MLRVILFLLLTTSIFGKTPTPTITPTPTQTINCYVIEIETKTIKTKNTCNPALSVEILNLTEAATFNYTADKSKCTVKLLVKTNNIDKVNNKISKLKIKKIREYVEPEPTPTPIKRKK